MKNHAEKAQELPDIVIQNQLQYWSTNQQHQGVKGADRFLKKR